MTLPCLGSQLTQRYDWWLAVDFDSAMGPRFTRSVDREMQKKRAVQDERNKEKNAKRKRDQE